MTNRATAALLFALASGGVSAADRHLGVATCAGSACHGAAKLAGGAVRQDEYLLWQRQDRHARAYATLRSERSRRIAANLGLGEPTEARECLVCHADHVSNAERGDRFQPSDGVGCEACHGAAERWLSPHVRGYANHRDRLAGGLYPTWEPKARAALCLSCHQGDAQRPMTHAIMGAGHPPLLFELDTFMALQPAHYDADADYVARKSRPDSARNWAVGQAVAARGLLAGAGAPGSATSMFPELTLFDCNACHHAMQPARWEPGQSPGLPPGQPRLADSALYFTALWLDVARPELAAKWRDMVKELHAATLRSAADLRDRAHAAQKFLEGEVMPLVLKHEHSPAELRKLALLLVEQGAGPRAADFSVAEQTAMATAVFATALSRGGKTPKGVRDAVNAVYEAVSSRDRYEPEKMRRALRQAREQIAKAYPGK